VSTPLRSTPGADRRGDDHDREKSRAQAAVPAKAQVADIFDIAGDPDITDAEVRLWIHYRRHHIGNRGAFVSDEATVAALGVRPGRLPRAVLPHALEAAGPAEE
jgi:hypothetical protein